MAAVLIVEDESHLANGLRFNLEAEGYEVDVVDDGAAALERLVPDHGYDVVVLDVMLPGVDGFQVASELRARGQFVPILMLTARGRPEDVLRGFEAGADDYLPKPFELAILIARLGGLLRRAAWLRTQAPPPQADAEPTASENVDEYAVGDRTIDFSRLEIRGANGPVRLTAMEADMLRYLIRHEGRVVSRKSLLEELWGLREDTDTRAIDNFVVRLRKYLEEVPSKPRHLLTVRGVGYRFVAEPEE
jgi:DNA-binding response OmpR family regulator